ncbi:hypothetical protein Gohar_027948, partial [Gossypium harknessii]|nr:hypothetical protein [Gossypium harknessii]
DETSVGGTGTVVRRSPRGSQSSGLIRDPSSLVSLLHFSHDSVHKKHYADNLAVNMLLLKMLLPAELLFSVANMMTRILLQLQLQHDEENAKITSSCIPLSMLLIPSLKEVIADDSEGRVMRVVTNSLIHMERTKPGSCEALVCKLHDRLASSKESSMKGLQDVAARVFNKGKVTPEDVQNSSPETDGKKRLQHKELHSNSNLSPLARFLLSRWQSQTSLDLNRVKMKTVRSIIHLCSICSDFDVHNIASNCRIFDIIDV